MAEALLATVALAVIAMAAAGTLVQRLRGPPALGYLAAGILLSPHTFGQFSFDESIVEGMAEVGVLFLLFLIGLELDLARLRKVIKATAVVMPFDMLIPMALAGGAARLAGWSVTQSLALGAAVALSSTLLGERLTAPPSFGMNARRRVLGVLVSEDVGAAALLAGLAILGSGAGASQLDTIVFDVGQMLVLLILLTGVAVLVVPRLLDAVAKSHVHELVVLWGIAIVVLWGYLGLQAGSAELGAFVAGVAAAEAGSRFVARNALAAIRDAAIALFFFSSGLAADIIPVLKAPWLALAVVGLFITAKIFVHVPAAIAAGLRLPEALRTAFALGALGEFSLILAAVADRNGLAHPDLAGTVVLAMLIALPISAALVGKTDSIVKLLERLPERWKDSAAGITKSVQRTQRVGSDPGRRRKALRRLIANLLVLIAWFALIAWGVDWVVELLSTIHPAWVQIGYWALALAVAFPLLQGAFQAYRDLAWLLVGLQPGERVGAGRVRVRMIDTLVALTAIPFLALISLSIPAALPVLAIAVVFAAGVAAVAWRKLNEFRGAMENAMARVLGEDPAAGRVLDTILREYPWGVRSAAVAVPPRSPVAGRTIRQSGIASLSGAMVAVIQRRRREIVGPGADELLLPGDTLILMGDAHQLEKAEALVVASGEALPLAAQSIDAVVEDVPITEEMGCVGAELGATHLRERAGVMVVGHWAVGGQRPRRYKADRPLQLGDRLLVLGTPLQIEKARELLLAFEAE